MSLSKRLRDCRYAKGWGPDELASRAQISRTALYQIESGKTETPRAGTLRRIAKALGVSTDELLGNRPLEPSARLGEDDPTPPPPAVPAATPGPTPPDVAGTVPALVPWAVAAGTRPEELEHKLRVLLDSPLGVGIARIIEEAYALLPPSQGKALG